MAASVAPKTFGSVAVAAVTHYAPCAQAYMVSQSKINPQTVIQSVSNPILGKGFIQAGAVVYLTTGSSINLPRGVTPMHLPPAEFQSAFEFFTAQQQKLQASILRQQQYEQQQKDAQAMQQAGSLNMKTGLAMQQQAAQMAVTANKMMTSGIQEQQSALYSVKQGQAEASAGAQKLSAAQADLAKSAEKKANILAQLEALRAKKAAAAQPVSQ